MEPIRPFRWDLVRPDRLGSLLDGVEESDLFFLDDLIDRAGVLAQCGDGLTREPATAERWLRELQSALRR
ncbi:hypothetical protein ACGFIF_04935 [Kribbella sp. NPDC049174]|uniref:hypothetical protein n=1 Tax=Kribbella sp. NPDC049174 TaxID=3364112 RepID=UPI0037124FD1